MNELIITQQPNSTPATHSTTLVSSTTTYYLTLARSLWRLKPFLMQFSFYHDWEHCTVSRAYPLPHLHGLLFPFQTRFHAVNQHMNQRRTRTELSLRISNAFLPSNLIGILLACVIFNNLETYTLRFSTGHGNPLVTLILSIMRHKPSQ